MDRSQKPLYKARGRALTRETNIARQTDSAAHTVELLQLVLAEQQRTNELLAWIAGAIHERAGRGNA